MAAIEVIDLNFSYGRNKILNKLSLVGQAGQCVGIVGRNGCGKSTLLSILAGMRKPVAGDIVLQGENAYK
ncbi:MAG: ATP-binding cassette domain-containing protein, partial [Lachnospiraceae bacterium]|nr:ATP-binding cassette domain-containing protein [Lachnospiraceae bacterium]